MLWRGGSQLSKRSRGARFFHSSYLPIYISFPAILGNHSSLGHFTNLRSQESTAAPCRDLR
eukprot:scaffold245_cov256-Pinguiococcus_pyrenoidosus.AAC.28